MKITIDQNLVSRPSSIIGRPQDCLNIEQDLENSDLCQVNLLVYSFGFHYKYLYLKIYIVTVSTSILSQIKTKQLR